MGKGNMTIGIRKTREVNSNIISKLYPIFSNIKDGYKKLKNGELFYNIIEDAIIKNPSLALELNKQIEPDSYIEELKIKYNTQKLSGAARAGII